MKSNRSFTTTLTTSAAATGALFALQHQADANIVYSGVQNLTASIHGNGSSFPVIPGLDGMFLILGRSGGLPGLNNAGISGGLTPSFSPIGNYVLDGSKGLKKLASGFSITAVPHSNLSGNLVFYQRAAHIGGSWAKSQTGFAAFQLANGDLGWIRMEWTNTLGDNGVDNLIAIDWAYNDQAGQAIKAGAGAVPEPGTAALLALAAAGGAMVRRRREAGKTE